jgi:hypothetical protein
LPGIASSSIFQACAAHWAFRVLAFMNGKGAVSRKRALADMQLLAHIRRLHEQTYKIMVRSRLGRRSSPAIMAIESPTRGFSKWRSTEWT